jgi:VanZ family protein
VQNRLLPWQTAFSLCALAVLTLSLLPQPDRLPTTGWDKTNHLLAFVTLAVLGRQAHRARPVRLAAGLVLFGGLIELLQGLTGYRSAEWIDWLADILGIGLGWLLARALPGR